MSIRSGFDSSHPLEPIAGNRAFDVTTRNTNKKTDELLHWVRKKNDDVNYKDELQVKERECLKQMLEGMERDREASSTIKSLVTFTSPKKSVSKLSTHGERLFSSLDSSDQSLDYISAASAFESALQNGSSYRKQYESGINPATILTEYRRKIILHGLTDGSNVDLPRNFCKTKITDYTLYGDVDSDIASSNDSVTVNSDAKIFRIMAADRQNRDTLASTFDASLKTSNSYSSTIEGSTINTNATLSVDTEFKPKWNSYPSMRSRWLFIQPQVKHLHGEDTAISPHKSRSQITSLDHGEVANIKEVKYIENKFEVKKKREERIRKSTNEMLFQREMEKNRYYRPEFGVRY